MNGTGFAQAGAPVKEENVLAGAVGAFLGALIGGLMWFLLYQVGFFSGLSGLVGAICAIKGYTFFSKGSSKKGVIISIIVAVAVMILAWYLCLTKDVYDAYQEWYAQGKVDFTVTFPEAFRGAYLFLGEGDIAASYFGELAIGLVLCVIGSFRFIREAFRKTANPAAPAAPITPESPVSQDPGAQGFDPTQSQPVPPAQATASPPSGPENSEQPPQNPAF